MNFSTVLIILGVALMAACGCTAYYYKNHPVQYRFDIQIINAHNDDAAANTSFRLASKEKKLSENYLAGIAIACVMAICGVGVILHSVSRNNQGLSETSAAKAQGTDIIAAMDESESNAAQTDALTEVTLDEQVLVHENGIKITATRINKEWYERYNCNAYLVDLILENESAKNYVVACKSDNTFVNGYGIASDLVAEEEANRGYYTNEICILAGHSANATLRITERAIAPSDNGENIPYQIVASFPVYEWNGIPVDADEGHYHRSDQPLFVTRMAQLRTSVSDRYIPNVWITGKEVYNDDAVEVSYVGLNTSNYTVVRDSEEIKLQTYFFVFEAMNKSTESITVKISHASLNEVEDLAEIEGYDESVLDDSVILYPGTVSTLVVYTYSDILKKIGVETAENIYSVTVHLEVNSQSNDIGPSAAMDLELSGEDLNLRAPGISATSMFQ